MKNKVKNAPVNFRKICSIFSILCTFSFLLQISDYHHLKRVPVWERAVRFTMHAFREILSICVCVCVCFFFPFGDKGGMRDFIVLVLYHCIF